MINIKGKWALLTGASKGIGYEIAKFMASQGCNLVLHSRTLKSGEKVLAEVLSMGVTAYSVAAELSDTNQINAMLDKIDANGTQIDIVLNNAGINRPYRKDYFKTPVEDFTSCFMINTIAPAMICYHFIPKMIERGFGRVVNTTSGISLTPEEAGYSASKAALDKLTIDLGSKINGTDVMINLTNPGWCRTELGGPNAHYGVESVIPGIVVGVFVNDRKSGRFLNAPEFQNMTLEDAVIKAESEIDSIY